jgi:inner membrane protein
MPCADTHRLINFLAGGLALGHAHANGNGRGLPDPVSGALLCSWCARLPDLVEPALHPNHRQFFHSVAFMAMLGIGLYTAYKWETEATGEAFLRGAMLVAGGAYFLHIAADACTAKSIPLIGKF